MNISDSVAQQVKATAPCQETRPVVSWPSVSLFSSTRVTGRPKEFEQSAVVLFFEITKYVKILYILS